jgi:hypothetical protein
MMVVECAEAPGNRDSAQQFPARIESYRTITSYSANETHPVTIGIHHLTREWMTHAQLEQSRRDGNRYRRRSVPASQAATLCNLAGTELRMLCAMAGLPVVSCGPNNPPLMGKYLCSAVACTAVRRTKPPCTHRRRGSKHGSHVVEGDERCPPVSKALKKPRNELSHSPLRWSTLTA